MLNQSGTFGLVAPKRLAAFRRVVKRGFTVNALEYRALLTRICLIKIGCFHQDGCLGGYIMLPW